MVMVGWLQFCRTIDSFIIGYAKQALSIFLVDLELIMDVVSFRFRSSAAAASNLNKLSIKKQTNNQFYQKEKKKRNEAN
jgi:hypothetical protein